MDIDGEDFGPTYLLQSSCNFFLPQIDSIARGLYDIHKCGIAHQDLALRNIILTDPKRFSGAVFLDFAFACKADDDSTKADARRFLLGSIFSLLKQS